MKIINIDAPKELIELFLAASYHIPDSIQKVLDKFEKDYYRNFNIYQDITKQHTSHSPVWKFESGRFENIAVLRHTIPIYLRDEAPEIERFNNNCKCIVDPLGAYISYWGNYTPHVELYLPKIYREAEKIYENAIENEWFDRNPSVLEGFKLLSTIVLLHELAHAALDIFNLEGINSSKGEEKVSYDTEFGKWREESMANAVALKIINQYGNKTLKKYAKKFMELQPAEYALGVKMEAFESSDFDSIFDAKRYGVDENLQQEWLDYAQGTPDWSGLKKWNAKLTTSQPR